MLDSITEAEPLDLLDPMRMPLLRSVLMETLSDRFMRQIAFGLFQRMRLPVQLLSCIQNVISHESAISALPEVMLAGISELSPLHGQMLLAIDGDLIGAMVDAMCGASEAHPFSRYELSGMEKRIGKQMIDLAFNIISETFSSVAPIQLQAIAYENATGMLAIADSQEWVIAVTGIFETQLGSGTIRIATPYTAFENLEVKINSQSGLLGNRGPDANWVQNINLLSDITPIPIKLEIARSNIPLFVIKNLKTGSFLPIEILSYAIAVGGGIDLFVSDYGQHGGYICCQVNNTIGAGGKNMSNLDEDPKNYEKTIETERVELERLQAKPHNDVSVITKAALDRVQVTISVELGNAQITVKELRSLRHGQIFRLNQKIGEPLCVYANGQLLAYGEVVAVANDHYGIRVTALADDASQAVGEDSPCP